MASLQRATDRPPGVRFERPHWNEGRLVAGIDEVGRGAWAGPVTVGVVVLDPARRIHRLRDSKLLPTDERVRVAGRIRSSAVAVAVGHTTAAEIDRRGMTAALALAAQRALAVLAVIPDVLLIDGPFDFVPTGLGARRQTIVRGDSRSASIAAASIVAKVCRDARMVAWDRDYPTYRFARNKGYPSPDHRAELDRSGPCPIHRHSWSPIAARNQMRLFG